MEERAEPLAVIAVDGEAASGKSVCKIVAERLGFSVLDTGSIYRTSTLLALASGVDPYNPDEVEKALWWQLRDCVRFHEDKLTFGKITLGDEIRTPQIDKFVPHVAEHPGVRRLVTSIQHRFAGGRKVIAEGRDIGSVVFPKAKVKFYLTADIFTRTQRRLHQIHEKDPNCGISPLEVYEQLSLRDYKDKTRKESPLVCLPEAVVIDTSKMTKEQVVGRMLEVCKERGVV